MQSRRPVAGGEAPDEQGEDGDAEDDRHEHRRDPIGQSLHGRFAVLRTGDEIGHGCQRRVRTHTGGTDLEHTGGVDRGAGDGISGADLDRNGFAGEHCLIDGRMTVQHLTVGGDLLAGTDEEDIADGQLIDRHLHLDTAVIRGGTVRSGGTIRGGALTQHGRGLRAEVEQRLERSRRPVLRPVLGELADEQEHRDRRGRFEPHVVLGGNRPAVTVGDGPTQREVRVQARDGDADADEGVHGRRSTAGGLVRRGVERPRTPGDDGQGEDRDDPLPPGEVPAHDHRDRNDRHGQDEGACEARPQMAGIVVDDLRTGTARAGAAHRGTVAGLLDGGGDVVVAEFGIDDHMRGLQRQVDLRRDPVEAGELLLDPRRARRAGHARDVELELARHHFTS